jgi:hypothetical protein
MEHPAPQDTVRSSHNRLLSSLRLTVASSGTKHDSSSRRVRRPHRSTQASRARRTAVLLRVVADGHRVIDAVERFALEPVTLPHGWSLATGANDTRADSARPEPNRVQGAAAVVVGDREPNAPHGTTTTTAVQHT